MSFCGNVKLESELMEYLEGKFDGYKISQKCQIQYMPSQENCAMSVLPLCNAKL